MEKIAGCSIWKSAESDFYQSSHAPVVVPALLVLGALLVVCVLHPDRANSLCSGAQRWVVGHFDWFYTVTVTLFLLFLVLIAASRYGDIRLGPDDAASEFSFLSWTAMLFAAGMGIGLMYFGVAEPLQHYLKPPTQIGSRDFIYGVKAVRRSVPGSS